MTILYVGKFGKMWDEEYIAQGFENIGHKVIRHAEHRHWLDLKHALEREKPDILLFAKWDTPKELVSTIQKHQRDGMKTVCWVFDLYFDYVRENQVFTRSFFKADYVFTTDGGHDEQFKKAGVNHQLVRQGIRTEECFIQPGTPRGIVFVGTDSGVGQYRVDMIGSVKKFAPDMRWVGRGDSDEMRGVALNELYGNTKIVLGDSYYSPYYWSNRVVETLGRGGFLIHPEVPGLKEEYPHIVTYERGNWTDLKNRIVYYLNHEQERLDLIQKNYEWVRDRYTIEKKCAELISKL